MKLKTIAILFGSLFLIYLSAASAQQEPQPADPETRTAQIEAERDAKSPHLKPPTRSKVESFLYWYDNQYVIPRLFAGWKGFHLGPGHFPAGAGMKFGMGYTKLAIGSRYADEDLPNRIDVSGNVGYTTRDYSSYSGNLAWRNIAGAPVDFLFGGSHYRYPQEDFFGLGQDSLEDNRTDYLMESSDFGTEAQWRPHQHLSLVAGASYLTPDIGSGTDDRFPSSEDVFDPTQLPGFDEQPDFLKITGKVAYDWRDNPLHPHRGGFYGVTFADYRDRDLDSYDFRRYDIELQQYIPLPHRYRILALRAAAVLTDTQGDQQVPFYYMPTLGGSQNLRGFREFRFRDQNALMFTAEYRWEAWWALDGAFFVDAGQVAARREDFKLDDMDVSYGFGLRFHSNKAFVFRLDFAFSKEGFIPLLRWEHAF